MSIGASLGGDPSGLRASPAPPQPAASNASSESRRRVRMDDPEMGVRSNAGRATFRLKIARCCWLSRGRGRTLPARADHAAPFRLSSSSGTSANPQARSWRTHPSRGCRG